MKKFILSIAALGIAFSSFANIEGNGFYRVRNYGSTRWASLIDNNGSVDLVAASADLHALQLVLDTEEILSDPGSIVYLTNITGKQYDMAAQGTSLEAIASTSIYIGEDGKSDDGQTLYRLWGTSHNTTKYIADARLNNTAPYGYATINNINSTKFKQWLILPMNVTDNYFAAVPSVNANGGMYCSLFTSFPYKPYSTGVKAYYINRVGFGMAEMVEITDAVPTGSPVVIKCAGTKASDNKMQIVNSDNVLPNNCLTGVYFNYTGDTNTNRVAYNPKTMRVLGVCSDGSLGFVTDYDLDFIPANTAYLKVPEGSLAEFKCVPTSEFEANLPEAPEQLYCGESILLLPQDDYTYTATVEIPKITSKNPYSIRFTSSLGSNEYMGPVSDDYTLNMSKTELMPFAYNSDYSWVLRSFTGGDLSIELNLQYQYIKFYSQNAGIDAIVSADNGLHFNGFEVYGEFNGPIRLYNMAGEIVAESYSGSLNVSNMPKGIYVAVADGKSIKIMH